MKFDEVEAQDNKILFPNKLDCCFNYCFLDQHFGGSFLLLQGLNELMRVSYNSNHLLVS